MLSVVSHGYETWTLAFREVDKLSVFENSGEENIWTHGEWINRKMEKTAYRGAL
jgi:hypothetical protein